MQQVGGAVVEHDLAAPRRVHRAGDHIPAAQDAGLQAADVAEELAGQLLRVGHREARVQPVQLAGIADLAARLAVERRAVEDDDGVLPGFDRFDRPALVQQGQHHHALGLERVVAEETGRLQARDQVGRQLHAAAELAGRARGLALLLHRRLEAGDVHAQAALARDVLGEVEREAVGVVEAERIGAGNGVLRTRGDLVEDPHARVQRLGEAFLLGQQRLLDQPLTGGEFGIGLAHQRGEGRHQAMEERPARAQHPAMAQRAADDPAQYVAPALVRGQHAIDDQEAAGADVIGDDAQRLVLQVGHAGEFGGLADQRLEEVDLVVAVHVLQHGRQPLQAHAGIDARRRQRHQGAVGLLVELHEHEVPDLDVAVAVLVGRARRAAGDVRAVVVEDLGAGAAGAGVGHLPEVVGRIRRALVVADAHDPLFRHADHVAPQRVGFLVGVIDGDQQALGRQLPHAGQQFPGPGDGVLLEVVAERPVAQHLEEGVVAGGVTHRVQVVVLAAGAQAALDVGRAHVAALLRAQEHVLELDHPRVGEQQGRVVGRYERRGRHDLVALAAEEFEEIAADARGGIGTGRGHGGGCKRAPRPARRFLDGRRMARPVDPGEATRITNAPVQVSASSGS